jgi:hypothetical protein
MKCAAALLFLALGGCAAARSEASPPPPRRSDPSIATFRIQIDTRNHGVGAYTLSLRWNPDVAWIEEIVPGNPRDFKGTPEYDPASFSTGHLRITSIDVFGSRPMSAPWELFTVVFRKRAPGALSATATLEKLYDDQNRPFQGVLLEAEFHHTFP